jgi:hypothetical protein
MPLDALQQAASRLHGDEKMARLGEPARIWAVGSLYGHYGALCQLHEVLATQLRPRDRLVYLGNYLGNHSLWAGEGVALLDEMIAFRNAVIAIPGFFADDVIFLRGQREDLLLQLLRLPFQRQPARWLDGALGQGLESYLQSYGVMGSLLQTIDQGLIALNHWANRCRGQMNLFAGHQAFFEQLRSCAATQYSHHKKQVMLVPSGIDPRYPLHMQYEQLQWPEVVIGQLNGWQGCSRLIRGFSPEADSFNQKSFVLSLDGKDTLEGNIHAVCLDPQGQMLENLTF